MSRARTIWPQVAPFEGLKLLKNGLAALDVRSPGEFLEGHIPGFINIGILNDEHRHQVGLTYKTLGNEKAVNLGHQLVDPSRSDLVKSWRQALDEKPGLVACWRGGLRSKIAAEWLADSGAEGQRIEGGYKALRQVLLQEINHPREWVVLGGLTGSGKTEVLKQLAPAGVLDLEGLAKHRGSAFGRRQNDPQPAQQTFENGIGLILFDNPGLIVVENESALVGDCSVPLAIRVAIRESALVRLVTTMDDRVRRVFAEYVVEPLATSGSDAVRDTLLAAVMRIKKALGGLRAEDVSAQIQAAFAGQSVSVEDHRPWIESLLKDYYDPRYEYGLKRDQRKILYEGSHEAVRGFLADLISRRRA